MNEFKTDIFSVPVWSFINDKHQLETRDYINYILKLKNENDSLSKSNVGGWHSSDGLQNHNIFKELVSEIEYYSSQILRDQGITNQAKINNLWAVVNDKYGSLKRRIVRYNHINALW